MAIIIWLALALALARPGPVLAEEAAPAPAMLVADSVTMDGNERLIATGNVEVLYQGRRLRAQAITYDRRRDWLSLRGPIVIDEEDGERLILAESGELDKEMRNGILRGARMVMGNQIQMAAFEIDRAGGRFTQLRNASVTSCRICETGQPPLWQIRARRVVHDQLKHQLYFSDAQLRVLDTPVFYLPRLRLPDPTVKRTSGFLVPSVKYSSLLGFGVRVPYFITMGDDKDLTIAPVLTTNTRTLELRYRQAFRKGRLELQGALSNDDFGPRDTRGYIFGKAQFDLPDDLKLRFQLEAVTDDTYLLEHDYSEKDRLKSGVEVERSKRDSYLRGALSYYHTLRPGENNNTLPAFVGDAEYERRLHPARMGGELRLGVQAHSHVRSSGLSTDGTDRDVWADGRDVARLTASADWQRDWVLPGGVLANFGTGLAVDRFEIRQAGVTSDGSAVEVTPSVEIALRWPLVSAGAGSATQVIEPMMKLAWVGGDNPFVPNDENTRIEFDEGNLLSTSHFVASDRRERGLIGAFGLGWTRYGMGGSQASLALGQLVRDKTQREANGSDSFSESSGLDGNLSDLLVAGQIKAANGLTLTARSLFNKGLDSTKTEARASSQSGRTDFGATYIWLGSDLAEDRPKTVSEWAFDTSYRMSRHWTGSADWRYDVESDKSVRAGVGISYTNECVEISLSAARRFTSSTVLDPSTNINLTVALRGFTTKVDGQSYARTCNE